MAAARGLGIGTCNSAAAAAAHFSSRGGLQPVTKHAPLCLFSSRTPLPPTTIKSGSRARARARASGTSSSSPSSRVIMASSAIETEKLGIKIVKNPPESKLSELGVRSWPKWGCPPSNFPWTYSAKETCFLLKGKVKVYPEGSEEGVEIGAGDLVIFPKGMSCTWDVSEAVDKHYQFE